MKTAKAAELDRMFDEGEDMSEYMDFSAARRVNRAGQAVRKVNVDFTARQVRDLDEEAEYAGINRQAVIKTLCDEALIARRERRARLAEALRAS